MKLLIDIADNKAESFMEMIKNHSYVKAKAVSAPDAELFAEIKEIKKTYSHSSLIIKQKKIDYN